MASLCISWPVHAGIMPFRVANSSFILDLRLRSITLCAVFLAIFLPAALVELGGFFVAAVAFEPDLPRLFVLLVLGCDDDFEGSVECCDLGVI